jgi:SAM-dependent methyltransferase
MTGSSPTSRRAGASSTRVRLGAGREGILDRGYEVVAFDASAAIEARLGPPRARGAAHAFEEMAWRGVFDGIWCCASLLHVPRALLQDVVPRLKAVLRPGGICYLSLKLGRSERLEEGRLFTDQDEASLAALLAPDQGLEVVELWRSADRRPGRAQAWLNCLARRVVPVASRQL